MIVNIKAVVQLSLEGKIDKEMFDRSTYATKLRMISNLVQHKFEEDGDVTSVFTSLESCTVEKVRGLVCIECNKIIRPNFSYVSIDTDEHYERVFCERRCLQSYVLSNCETKIYE